MPRLQTRARACVRRRSAASMKPLPGRHDALKGTSSSGFVEGSWRAVPRSRLSLAESLEAAGPLLEQHQPTAAKIEMETMQLEQSLLHALLDEGKSAEIGDR
jgi:hypothetical protein